MAATMHKSKLLVKVHPVVLFGIVDSFERRNEDARRVIGTLLGSIDKGVIEVTNCFTVPHTEYKDEVAVDTEFAKKMYELHKKVNANEQIVGWYSTGLEVTEHSLLIHEFYSRECKDPVHLLLDTTLKGAKMTLKTYISYQMGIVNKNLGTLFVPIPNEITSYDPEKVGVDLIQKCKTSKNRSVTMDSDLNQITNACARLQDMLTTVGQYVDDVLAGIVPANNDVGRKLMDCVTRVPKIDPEKYEEMLNSNMKDLLMVVYLSNLTKTQLTLQEALHDF